MSPQDEGRASAEAKYLAVDEKLPWKDQLDQASTVLNIDLNECCAASLEDREPLAFIDPSKEVAQSRYDLGLRWLLKGLVSQNKEPTDRCMEWKGWAMLQELLRRCNLLKVATILKKNGLIVCAEITLVRMRDETATEFETERFVIDESTGEPLWPDSSRYPASKKRKRGERSPSPNSLDTPVKKRKALFVCLCGVLQQLLKLIRKSESDGEENTIITESLRHTLNSNASDAADLLGSAWYLMSDFMQGRDGKRRDIERQRHTKPSTLKSGGYRPYLIALVDIWEFSIRGKLAKESDEYHRAFCARSLVHCLQYLRTRTEYAHIDLSLSEISGTLRRLLADHVLLPYRQAVLKQDDQSPESQDIRHHIIHSLVQGLTDRRLCPTHTDSLTDYKTRHHTWNALLSMLFSIAVESRPRQSQKQRLQEDPWLERLFLDLGDVVGDLQLEKTEHKDKKYRVRLIRFLLETCCDRKVKLSITTLQQVLDFASGLGSEDENITIDWHVISYCLAIDPDVFITSQQHNDRSQSAAKEPNTYLKSLLKASSVEKSIKDRVYVTYSIILPLLNAFVNARDILQFVDVWSDQLKTLDQPLDESMQSEKHRPWQDEAVFTAVSDQIESLTIEQLHSLVRKVLDDRPDDSGSVLNVASATILSSLFRGINTEGTIQSMRDLASEIFKIAASSADSATGTVAIYQSRLLTAILQRWSLGDDLEESKHQIMRAATQRLTNLPSWASEPEKKKLDYREEFESFRCILSMPKWQGILSTTVPLMPFKVEHPMAFLMESMRPFQASVQNDFFGKFCLDNMKHKVYNPGSRIKSLESLYLACTAHMLSKPSNLIDLGSAERTFFIQQIYTCAVYHWRSSSQLTTPVVDFNWPWQQLLKILPAIEDPSIHRPVAGFQVEQYLKASSFGDFKYLNITTPDYRLAFEAACNASFEELDQAQLNRLADRVLEIIMLADLPHIPELTIHFIFLDKLLCHPSKAMSVFSGRQGNFNLIAGGGNISLLTRLDNMKSSLFDEKGLTGFYKALKLFVQLSIKFLIKHAKSDVFAQNLRQIVESLESKFNQDEANGKFCRKANSIIIGETLNSLLQDVKKLEKHTQIEYDRIQRLRDVFVKDCLYYVQHVSLEKFQEHDKGASFDKVANVRLQLGLCLEHLASAADVLRTDAEFSRTCREGTTRIWDFIAQCSRDRASGWIDTEDTFGPQYLAIRLMDLELEICEKAESSDVYLLASCLLNPVDSARSFRLTQHFTDIGALSVQLPKERTRLIAHIQDSISRFEPADKVTLLSKIPIADGQYDSSDQGALYIIRSVILTTPAGPPEDLRRALSQTISTLILNIPKLHFTTATLALQSLFTFLQTHSSSVLQFHIDAIFPSLEALASTISSNISSTRSAHLYLASTRILTAILRSHRPKLGARFGLLLPTLQALLRCLFTPYPSSSTPPTTETSFPSQPTDPSPPLSALRPAHAASFAGILLLLCDPSPSSVRRRHHAGTRENINDDIRAAKSILRTHIPPLLETFTIATLTLSIPLPLKEKLMPGIWAAMDLLEEEDREVIGGRLRAYKGQTGEGIGEERIGEKGEFGDAWGEVVRGWKAVRRR